MTHGLVAVYMCSSRYSGPHPCSAFEYYSGWIALPIVIIVGLFSHQGYRYRRRRQSSFTDDTVMDRTQLESSGPTRPPQESAGFNEQSPIAGLASPGATSAGAPPAGWYPNPDRPGQQRYWYGDHWAPSLAPGVSPGGVPGAAPGAPPPASGRSEDAPGWGSASY